MIHEPWIFYQFRFLLGQCIVLSFERFKQLINHSTGKNKNKAKTNFVVVNSTRALPKQTFCIACHGFMPNYHPLTVYSGQGAIEQSDN